MDSEAGEFEVRRPDFVLRGTSEGEGVDVVLCHGLSATRGYVLHGSRHLPRSGYRLHLFDARGHGESDPAPEGEGYGYPVQVEDLDAVIGAVTAGRPLVVGGHSMGCHTAAAWALLNPDQVDALVLIGPVHSGRSEPDSKARWDSRAAALDEGGPEAFSECVAREFTGNSTDRELVSSLALRRTREHRHPSAVADALRQVPRSSPFDSIELLGQIAVPTLVVGSRDEIDSGHPLAVAMEWAERIPDAEFLVESKGDSPLAWQGGRLSRVITEFLDRRLPEKEANA